MSSKYNYRQIGKNLLDRSNTGNNVGPLRLHNTEIGKARIRLKQNPVPFMEWLKSKNLVCDGVIN